MCVRPCKMHPGCQSREGFHCVVRCAFVHFAVLVYSDVECSTCVSMQMDGRAVKRTVETNKGKHTFG